VILRNDRFPDRINLETAPPHQFWGKWPDQISILV
jgi:hypothetical protein